FDGANSGGNLMTGVDGRSVCVRSTTRTALLAIAAANCVITVVPDITYLPFKAGGRGRGRDTAWQLPSGLWVRFGRPSHHRNEIPHMRSTHFLWRSCHVQCD